MHFNFTFVFFFLATCLLPSIAAIHRPGLGSLAKRGNNHKAAPPQSIVQRQHHVRRALIDVCISIDAGVLTGILGIIDPLAAKLHLCLCLKDLNIFLDTDLGLRLGKLLGGRDNVTAALKLLINTSPQARQCTLPTHAHRACVVNHPCAIICEPPYVQSGETCICPPPLSECNGQCGNFPHGCSSQVAQHPKTQRAIGPVTTLEQAQVLCKPNESVCGIPDSEKIYDFECVDTSVTLDSCGGCVTPHRFPAADRSIVKGKDCGRLPGVVTADCSNSQCFISQCREGWEPNSDHSECTKNNPGGGLRMRKERRRDISPLNDSLDADIVVNSELLLKITGLVHLVVKLKTASEAVPQLPVPHIPGSSPPIDRADLVNTIVAATAKILVSHSVVSLIANVDSLVVLNALVVDVLRGCGCVDALGLTLVVKALESVVEAALDIQHWCGGHPVGIPAPHPSIHPISGATVISHLPSSSTALAHTGHPIPNNSNTPITVGLGDLLASLGLGLKGVVTAAGLGSRLTTTVNSPLNALGAGPANVRSRTLDTWLEDGVVDPKLLSQIKSLLSLFATSKDLSPQQNGPTSPDSPDTAVIYANIVVAVGQATNKLVDSKTVASGIESIEALIDISVVARNALGGCGCIDALRLGPLVKLLDDIIEVALGIQEWCSRHPVMIPASPSGSLIPHPSSTPTPSPATTSRLSSSHSYPTPTAHLEPNSNDGVIVGLDDLLKGLGLGAIQGDIVVEGLVGDSLASALDGLLNDLGIGPANVRPRRMDGSPIFTEVKVDTTLLAQIKALVNLVVILKDTSSSSSIPPNSLPIIGDVSIPDSNGPPSVDASLVENIVQATIRLLESTTVDSLLENLGVLVKANELARRMLDGCGCVDKLGLGQLNKDLEEVIEAALGAQRWCEHHPVVAGVPTISLGHPSGSSNSEGRPNPAIDYTHIPISIGLDDLLTALKLDVRADVNSNVELQGLVDALVQLVVNLLGDSSSLPPPTLPTSPTSDHPTSAPAPHSPTTPHPRPLTRNLVDGIVHAAENLVKSLTRDDLLSNVNALLDVNGLLGRALGGCGCVENLGLGSLVKDVDDILNALLGIKNWCHRGPIGGGNSGNGTVPGVHGSSGEPGSSGSTPIIINSKDLLKVLKLSNLVQVNGTVNSLGDGISGFNSLLHSLGLGGVKRWLTRD